MSKSFNLNNIGDFSLTESYFDNWFKEIRRVLKETGKILIFCDETLYVVLFRSAYKFFNTSMLVWKKNKVGLGRNYRKTFEIILYGKSQSSKNFKEFRRDILEFKTPSNKVHPTQKPVELIKYLISPEDGQLILDPFMGSGTTAIACKELGRDFIGFEINKDYLDIANKRLEQSTLNNPNRKVKR
jgi:site-specific DNA-methyltransferase (adenine-specific)